MAAPSLASLVGGKPGAAPAASGGGGRLPSLQSVLGSGGGKLPSLKDVLSGNNSVVPAKKPGGHGVLGWIGKEVGQTGSDLYHAAIDAPAGVYYTAKGLATDPAGTVKQFGHQILQDVEHPLRHPGYTLLDLVGALDAGAGTAARLGAAGAALGEGATAADVARSLVKHPGYGTRTLRSGGLEVNPETSRSAVGAAVQHASDKLLQQAADKNPAGRAADLVNRKVGKVVAKNAHTAEQIAKGPGAALIKIGRGLSPAEQKALQVVAEQAPVEGRITATAARIIGAKDDATRGRHQAELALLHEAQPLLTEANGKPSFADAGSKAARAYKVMENVAGDRETLLKNLGMLTDESIQSRTTNAGRVALGAHYVTEQEAKAAAQSAKAAGAETEKAVAQQGREQTAAVTRRARDLDAEATRAESAAFNAGTRRTAAERESLAAMTRADRAAERASTERFKNAPRAEAGAHAGRLLQREQRLAQIVYERFQRGEVGPGVLDRAQRRLGRINDAYEPNASAVIKMREATDDGMQAARDQNGNLDAFRAAEQNATDAYQAAQREAETLRGRAVGASYRTEFVKKLQALKTAQAHAATERAMAEQLGRAKRIAGAEDFTPDATAIRIPDVVTKGRGSRGGVLGRVGAQGTIGHLKEPGSITHEYTGALREAGLRREDTAQLVGESSLEAAKYAGLQHIHDLVRQAAQPTPGREDDIAVRLDELKAHDKLPLDVRKFVDHPEDFFAHATPAEQATVLDKVRAQMFPTNLAKARTLTGDAAAEFQRLNEQGKIGWVPKKVLGRLAEPQAPLAAVAGKAPVKVVDAINNASRFSILYLKPAYALPNILGNGALNVLQQGWAAVPNLARAARINATLGPDLAARIDSAMGEGVAQSVAGHEGLGTRVVQGAANKWGGVVDTPFRRASFLYEARHAGYKTPDQIERLLTDQSEHQHLIDVSNRANSEAIDYSNMSPVEKEIIRRVVFFYPWLKGSTVYAGRLLKEHPIKSAVIGQVGELGHERTGQALGQIPSYLEGIFPVGKDSVVNPNSAAILQTPAQVGSALAGLATGNINQASQASGFLTPALTLALAEALRENPGSGRKYPGGTNAGTIAQDVLGSQLPQVSLERNLKAALTGKGGSRLYPPSVRSALLQFLVGGAAPRKIDLNDLHRLARSEQTQMRTGR